MVTYPYKVLGYVDNYPIGINILLFLIFIRKLDMVECTFDWNHSKSTLFQARNLGFLFFFFGTHHDIETIAPP